MNQVLVARDRDADLIPSNVRAGVAIDDTLGTYVGGLLPLSTVQWIVHMAYHVATRISTPAYRIIDMPTAIYVVYFGGWLRVDFPSPNLDYLWWIKYNKADGVITRLPQTSKSWYYNSPPELSTCYVDWTNIHFNISNANPQGHTLDTLTDTRWGWWWTTGVLNTATSVMYWWLTITPTIQGYAPLSTSRNLWFVWYLSIT